MSDIEHSLKHDPDGYWELMQEQMQRELKPDDQEEIGNE